MALYDPKKKPLTPLEQQAAASQAAYGASVGRATTAQQQAQRIQIPAPIIKEGRGGFSSIAQPGQDAALTALRTLGGVQRQEQAKQTAMIPTFQAQAAGLRQQAGADRAKAATLGANTLLQGVGAAPIAAPATPRPAAVASATPAPIASPGVRFAGIDAAPDNFYRNPAGTKPRTAAELNQASQAEVAARNQASRPGTSLGAGASTPAGAGAPINKSVGKFGETVYSNVGSQYGAANPSTIGGVQTQNFGNPVVPQAQASIARPGVASTFGLGVNDPRLDSQIARPPVQLGPNQTAGGGTLASPSSMGRYYANKEDREATQKLLGDIDTQMFMARGKNTPSARRLMEGLASAKAQAIGNMAANTTEQANENTRGEFGLANTGMEQAGATQRQQMAGDVAREGNLLDFNASMANTAASMIQRPETVTTADGTLMRIGGDGPAQAVVDAQGNPVRGQQTQAQQRDYSKEADDKLIADLLDMQRDPMTGALAPGAVQAAQQQFQQLRAAQNPQPAAPAGMKQVGTSGGKPVYEDAKGNRFTL